MLEKKIEILNKVLGHNKQQGNEYLYCCPFCSTKKQKFSVNFKKDAYKCWICEIKGKRLAKIVYKFGSAEDRFQWPKDFIEEFDLKQEEILIHPKLPEEFVSLVGNNSNITKPFRSYLKGRGITEQDICFWKIGYCIRGEYADCVIIPSFDQKGRVNYFIARHISGRIKYQNPDFPKEKIIFNDLNLDFDRDIVIVEGVFDAIKSGNNSIPILGSSLSEDSMLFKKIIQHDSTIFFALDPDAVSKQMDLIKKFLKYDIECHEVSIEPYKDAGEMTKQQFAERKEMAKQITNDNFFEYSMMVRMAA